MRKKLRYIDEDIDIVFVSSALMPLILYEWGTHDLSLRVGYSRVRALLNFPAGELTSEEQADARAKELCRLAGICTDFTPGIMLIREKNLPRIFIEALKDAAKNRNFEVWFLDRVDTDSAGDYISISTENN